MKLELCGRRWIEGRWQAAGGEKFEAVNPATGKVLAPSFAETTGREVDTAWSAARGAFLALKERDPRWPADLLDAIAATLDPGTTSVGSAAIRRFVRPLAYQNTPQELLPPPLRDDNPLGIMRLVNGQWTDRRIESQTR